MPYKSKEKKREYNREYRRANWHKNYSNNKEYYNTKMRKQKLLLDDLRDRAREKPCLDCGDTFPICAMDFDHRPGEIKLFGIARMLCSVERMEAEIAKCDVVCANCHRIRTWQRILAKNNESQLSVLEELVPRG